MSEFEKKESLTDVTEATQPVVEQATDAVVAEPALATAGAAPAKKRKLQGGALQKMFAFAGLVLVVVYFSLTTDYFFSTSNLMTVLLSSSFTGIVAVGVTFIIITGGIDLSIGFIPTFSAVVFGVFTMKMGFNIWIALLIGLLAGAICGGFTGTLVARFKLPPFVASLGLMMILQGLSLVITEAKPIDFNGTDIQHPTFDTFAIDSIFPKIGDVKIHNFIIVFVIVAIIASIILNKTTFGRYTYAMGSNEDATRLSGVNTNKWKILVYMLCGLLCAVAGILQASRINVQPAQGAGAELSAIAAVVIGGTSLSGGEGSIMGTVIGTLLMSTLANGLQMKGVSNELQLVFTGSIVIVAVLVDIMRRRQKA